MAWIDGGSRGNPGEAGFGVLLRGPGDDVGEELYGYLGETTNNVAEYSALIALLELAVERGIPRLTIHSDSQLLVRQLSGEYRVRNPVLRELHFRAMALMDRLGPVAIRHVPRERNRHADRLAQRAMNLRRSGGPQPAGED
jgi:ribonuclease HI